MKRVAILSIFLASFSAAAFAEVPIAPVDGGSLRTANPSHYVVKSENGFFFKPGVSIEYSAPVTSAGGSNADFKTNNFGKQFRGLENLALGLNLRVHNYLGFNANWAQTDLNNTALQNTSLSSKAHFKLDQYNFSALFYLPIEPKTFELFAEAGGADINSRLTYNATVENAHETKAFVGAGFQAFLSQKNDSAIRFGVQRYCGKLALINTDFTTVRIGYLKFF